MVLEQLKDNELRGKGRKFYQGLSTSVHKKTSPEAGTPPKESRVETTKKTKAIPIDHDTINKIFRLREQFGPQALDLVKDLHANKIDISNHSDPNVLAEISKIIVNKTRLQIELETVDEKKRLFGILPTGTITSTTIVKTNRPEPERKTDGPLIKVETSTLKDRVRRSLFGKR